jgi:hypothetical protein
MKILLLLLVVILIPVNGCQKSDIVQQSAKNDMVKEDVTLREATFAGGCFWCTEADLEKLPGVVNCQEL